MRTIGSILLVSALVLISGCAQPSADLEFTKFPPQLNYRVVLLPSGKGGEVRTLYLDKESGRLVKAEIDYPEGFTDYQLYREDGTLKEVIGFFKEENGKPRQVRRNVLYDLDGKTVLYERKLRQDGSVEMTARVRGDGALETETFYPGSKQVELHRIVASGDRLILEEKFHSNGNFEQVTKRTRSGSYEVTDFRADGTRQYVTVRGGTRYDPVKRTVFAADGEKVEMRVEYSSYDIEVTYYRGDGTISETRIFYRHGSMKVTVHGADGKQKYRQTWSRPYSSSDDWTDESGYKLTGIDELDDSGTVIREIKLYDDGKTVKEVRVPEPGNYWGGKYRYFRPDGTLEKEEIKEDYSTVKETKEFTPEENIKEEVPADWLNRSEKPKVPKLAEMPIERPSYYGGCGCGCGDDYNHGALDPFGSAMPPFGPHGMRRTAPWILGPNNCPCGPDCPSHYIP